MLGVNDLEGFGDDLKNWNGALYPVVRHRHKLWFVKVMDATKVRRELLAYNLIKGACNTPEVKKVTPRLLRGLQDQGISLGSKKSEVVLIRMAQDLDENDLPNQTLDTAAASELIFSLWIRRRDADVWNRTHLGSGLPVFYDLNACLDFEPALYDIKDFFSFNRYGYGGSWRVKERSGGQSLSTKSLREAKDHFNYIESKEGFLESTDKVKKSIRRINLNNPLLYHRAGYSFSDAKRVKSYLKDTLKTLDRDVEVMKEVIFSKVKPDKDR